MALTKAKASNILLTTPAASSNDVTPATTQYVTTALANLADSAPSTLNTLNELAAALGDDANFSTTVTNSIATKLPLAGGTMTGALGIGGSPSATLHITQSTDGSGVSGQEVNTAYFHNQEATAGHNYGVRIKAGSNATDYALRVDTLATNGVFEVDGTGKVGIGTSSPGSALHISGGNNLTSQIRFTNTAPSPDNDWTIGSYYNDQGLYFRSNDNATNAMVMLDTGKVGIGISPTRTFTVKSAAANATQISLVDNDSTNEVFAVGQQSDGDGFLTLKQDDGTTKVLFDASGDSYVAGGSFHVGSTDSVASSAEVFSVYNAGTGHSRMVNGSDSYGTLYMHNESTTANTFQPSIILQKSGGNRGNIGVRHSDSVLGISGQGGISLRTANSSLQASTEALFIGSDSNVTLNGASSTFAHNEGDNLQIGTGSGDTGMTFYTGNNGRSSIYFGNNGTNGNVDGAIKYFHETYATASVRRGLAVVTGNATRGFISNSTGQLVWGHNAAVTPTYPGTITAHRTGGTSSTTQNTWSFNGNANGYDRDFGFKASGTGAYAYGVINTGETTWMSRLDFAGAIHLTNLTIQNISDRRLKKDIVDANSQWNDIKALQFKNYKWINPERGSDTYLGLIADEVESVSPNLVGIDVISAETMPDDGIDPEYKNVKYSIVFMKAVKALQEAMTKIETLETKLESAEARIETLEG